MTCLTLSLQGGSPRVRRCRSLSAGPPPKKLAASLAASQRTLSAVNSSFLVVIVVMMGAMFLMTRSAKKKQAQAAEMRNKMEPGSGIRTIGGMYALVMGVNEDSVELEVAPGVHAIYAKNA